MIAAWMGDIALAAWIVLLLIQLLLCFKIKSKVIRLLPVILLSVTAICFAVMSAAVQSWDAFGYLFLAIFAGFMLFACGIGWGIWGIANYVKRKAECGCCTAPKPPSDEEGGKTEGFDGGRE